MKKITLLFIFIGITMYGQTPTKNTPETNVQITTASIAKTLGYLSSDALKGRKTGSEGIEKAAKYIEQFLKKAHLKPYYKTYRDSFQFKGITGYNIVAYKEGSDPTLKNELVIIGAHYDHIGIRKPVNGDSIANGTNDDASGTTAVLELAKYFAHKKTKRSILFALFSGEEEGLIGSAHLARRLKDEKANVYCMLEFEMIGVPLKNVPYMAYLTGYDQSNFGEKFNAYAGKKVLGFWDKAKAYRLFKRSDNYPFYYFLKIPAHTLSTFNFKNFTQYHKVGDEMELANLPAMQKLIVATIPGITGIVNAKTNELKVLQAE